MANKTIATIGYHAHQDALLVTKGGWFADKPSKQYTEFTYTFENFFHPFVSELIEQLNKASLPGLLDPNYHQSLTTPFFDAFYTALTSREVKVNHSPKEIDLRDGGPYANYNWELLFHVPLTIAVHLSKNQRFAEAQRWFHYIFDPTSNDTSLPVPQRFWKFLAFRKASEVKQLDEQLVILSKPPAECTPTELDLKDKILQGYEAIKNKPFQPHGVARTRQLAYQYCVVMKYLDNLIAWGDSLFRQDTVESINEATQLYVLAANLLGQRPQRLPQAGAVRPRTFAELKKQGLDALGNALVALEGKFPLNLGLPQTQGADPDAAGPLFGIGRTLYFCIPRNEKLLSYWDTVADRLFKIRHCMNIEGVVRQLALFDPPLDPGMLVKAAAAGLDIGSIVNGLNQPVSPVRSLFLIQKALELCAEVRGLGATLLSAIEKGDGERLALLRQSHELKIQQLQQEVRFLQWKQAQEATASLLTNRATALARLHYYKRLLGLPTDPNAPDTLALDRRELTEENFDEAYAALIGQYEKTLTLQQLPSLSIAGDTSPAQQSGASGQGRLYLNTNEDAELNTLLPTARDTGLASSIVDTAASLLAFIPDTDGNVQFWGVGATIKIPVGTAISKSTEAAARILRIIATWHQEQAGMAARRAGHERRADDWMLQHNLAAHELLQIGRQILTSLIAEQIARHEYLSIKQQIEHSEEVDRFLHEKFSNEELYAWMQGEISRLYYEYYRFAFDTARKAEQALKRELMRPEVDATSYIKFNYWDGGRKGLLSGEALYLDVKRMELAYHEHNKREYELTKHVSLRQLNPLALLTLKATGACEVTLPESVFDLDTPGHYMRRIKNVSLTIPAVAGPYTSVSCTLTLLKSSVRKSALIGDDYVRQGSEDERFVDYFSATQSVVTSNGQNDSGLFETNLRDERFLPFEGAGAESTWKLELPAAFRQFDYNTISDVILHIRYTAREGGTQLRSAAVAHLRDLAATAGASGLGLLFSLRYDFPTEWSAFVNGNEDFAIRLRKDYFPYMMQSETLAIDALELYAPQSGAQIAHRTVVIPANLADDLNGENRAADLRIPTDADVLKRDPTAQVFLIVRYRLDG
jgi:Tc toxin complex TcA C-terminal TcB-binding domain